MHVYYAIQRNNFNVFIIYWCAALIKILSLNEDIMFIMIYILSTASSNNVKKIFRNSIDSCVSDVREGESICVPYGSPPILAFSVQVYGKSSKPKKP